MLSAQPGIQNSLVPSLISTMALPAVLLLVTSQTTSYTICWRLNYYYVSHTYTHRMTNPMNTWSPPFTVEIIKKACAFLLWGITKQIATWQMFPTEGTQFSLLTDDASHYLYNISVRNNSQFSVYCWGLQTLCHTSPHVACTTKQQPHAMQDFRSDLLSSFSCCFGTMF